jgi:hypothetical protein
LIAADRENQAVGLLLGLFVGLFPGQAFDAILNLRVGHNVADNLSGYSGYLAFLSEIERGELFGVNGQFLGVYGSN